MKKKIFILISVFAFLVLLYYLGVLSYKDLCGFRPGKMTQNPGKSWQCSCFGKIDSISTSYYERDYCTGLNLSYNKLLEFNTTIFQRVLYKRQRLN
jgi:hypothetical protein